ncbi:heme/hemin ABC transporter substrate-binding protein [Kiloniella sp. b19]|uniref:heme/hemin ABC transporter substrate-binding protein n=1 Tax=Kiloniella sp. GXU_MW_B19 TaxID=3141326 RepID=UPI0031D913CD
MIKTATSLIQGFLLTAALLATGPANAGDVPERILSVGGALTETVYALEAGEKLVGNDTTSTFPDAARALPKVGYQRALSSEGILSLAPDHLFMTDEAGPPPVLAQLKALKLPMTVIPAGRSLEDVKSTVRTIAKVIDKEQTAEELIHSIARDERKLAEKNQAVTKPKRVLFILQHAGGAPMAAGLSSAASSIIELAGAQNAVQNYHGYKPLTPEALVEIQPDALLLTSEGLAHTGGLESLLQTPGLALTPAVQNEQIIDMNALLLLGFGPRTAQAALQLHDALYAADSAQ